MYSSDDEDETLPSPVDNYHFEDDKKEPVSLSVLPVQWTASSESGDSEAKIFIQGDADNKLIKVYKPVVAWRFDLSNVKPEISVLLKGKQQWIKLAKPRKSYEETIRSFLVTVNCLHFATRNPESSAKSLWDSLCKDYGSFEVRPSESDLADHISLINEAVKRDKALEKSKFLADFLKGKPGKRRPAEETKAKPRTQFIVSDSSDDDGMGGGGEGDESDEEDEMFDSACAICDNGGDLLCCEGSCLRSFHPTPDEEEGCVSLGFTEEEVQATPQFLCKNCEYKQHQCFACGKLGSSDKYSGAEVFQCVSATCGYFFHPRCIAKLIHEDDKCSTEELEKKIKAGESFTCPAHKCCVCKQGENKKDKKLQFAVCRRCPKTFHRKCLPEEIPFANKDDDEVVARAWEDLLPNRILIYCLKHEIDEEFGTPTRNHIIFPGAEEEKKKNVSAKRKAIREEKRPKQEDKKRIETKKETHRQERKTAQFKEYKKQLSGLKVEAGVNSGKKLGSGDGSSRKVKANALAKKDLKSQRTKRNEHLIGNRLFAVFNNDSEEEEEEDEDSSHDEFDKAVENLLDADSKQRVLDIMKTVESEITMETIKARLKVPVTNQSSQKQNNDEKTTSLVRVENMVQGARTALELCQKRGNIEDAKAVCGPDVIKRIFKWRGRYKFYLAPFLHGMRYTSFGRHFTNPDKLQEIADKLQWYANDGDMVVDFCCGSNDFSIFMEKKLRELGKKCSYKNYDIIPAANDFNFEKRDWASVDPRELPNGSKLIMGLNPPFGIRGAKANVFIDKALQFKPKLIILIVPEETERLDEKETPYDLVWEDREMLAGKSFYLPGSTDVYDKTMAQWNYRAPPLCLWSRKDWTNTHKRIAEKCGHISKLRQDKAITERPDRRVDSDDDDFADMDEDDIVPPKSDYPTGREPERKGRESPPQTGGHRKKKPFDKSSSRKRENRQQNQGWQKNNKRGRETVPTVQNYDGVRERELHSPRTRISPPYTVPTEQNHDGVRDFRSRSPRVISPPYLLEQNYDGVRDFRSTRISPNSTSSGPSNTDHRDEPYEPNSPSQIAGRRFGNEARQRYTTLEPEISSFTTARQPQIETEDYPSSSSMSARAPSQDYQEPSFDRYHPGNRRGRQRTPPVPSSRENEIPLPMASFYEDAIRVSDRSGHYQGQPQPQPISVIYESGGPMVGPPGVIWPPGRAEMMHRTSISAWGSEPPRMYGANRRFEPRPGPPPLTYPPGSYTQHRSGGWLDRRPPGF